MEQPKIKAWEIGGEYTLRQVLNGPNHHIYSVGRCYYKTSPSAYLYEKSRVDDASWEPAQVSMLLIEAKFTLIFD